VRRAVCFRRPPKTPPDEADFRPFATLRFVLSQAA